MASSPPSSPTTSALPPLPVRSRPGRGGWTLVVVVVVLSIAIVAGAYLYAKSFQKSATLTLTNATPSNTTGGRAAHYDTFNVSATGGLDTSMFGLSLTNATGVAIAAGAVPAACTATGSPAFSTASCHDPISGWYAVLRAQNGTILATFGAAGNWTSPSIVVIVGTDNLVLVSSATGTANLILFGSGDVLSAYGLAGTTVTGSVRL